MHSRYEPHLSSLGGFVQPPLPIYTVEYQRYVPTSRSNHPSIRIWKQFGEPKTLAAGEMPTEDHAAGALEKSQSSTTYAGRHEYTIKRFKYPSVVSASPPTPSRAMRFFRCLARKIHYSTDPTAETTTSCHHYYTEHVHIPSSCCQRQVYQSLRDTEPRSAGTDRVCQLCHYRLRDMIGATVQPLYCIDCTPTELLYVLVAPEKRAALLRKVSPYLPTASIAHRNDLIAIEQQFFMGL